MNNSTLGQNAAPDGPDRMVISILQRSKVFRDYQQAFETSTGLPLALRSAGSFQAPLHGSKHSNSFCNLMAGTSQSCGACLQLQQRVEQEAVFGLRTIECYAGLVESAVPVRVGDRVLGYLQTGQVFLRAPTAAHYRGLRRRLVDLGISDENPATKTAYFETRVMARRQYDAVVKLLAFFAQHLGALSNQIMLQEVAAEIPLITRARLHIAEHLGETLTLRGMAKIANLSAFYYCKLFKQATGFTFTDYLARVRVEAVKQLLQNPNLRVCEAAFAGGFQSLSQFNRSFHRIAGVSPTRYRDQMLDPEVASPRYLARSA